LFLSFIYVRILIDYYKKQERGGGLDSSPTTRVGVSSRRKMKDILKKMASEGLIIPRKENNPYMACSYKGAGGLISPKWNIKIYTTGSICCTDLGIIEKYRTNKLCPPDNSLKVIQIDDSGGGFPLCGVLVGCTDGRRVVTDEIPVDLFKPGPYDRKEYLTAYALKGWALIQKEFKAAPSTHRIEICTGYINKGLTTLLREKGFDVRQVEIKGLLQDKLENLFKDYVKKNTGLDLAYDPKDIKKEEIGTFYYKALNWGKKYAPHLLKSGWKALKDETCRENITKQCELFE
jgi:hypothetical protein